MWSKLASSVFTDTNILDKLKLNLHRLPMPGIFERDSETFEFAIPRQADKSNNVADRLAASGTMRRDDSRAGNNASGFQMTGKAALSSAVNCTNEATCSKTNQV